MAEKIKIKYHVDGLEHVKKIKVGDWIDLRAAEDVTIRLGEMKPISLGVSMKLPAGYEAHIAPRSSTFKNWGIIQVNGVGVVDETYCGDNDIWFVPMLCMAPKDKPHANIILANGMGQNGLPAGLGGNISITSTIHKNDRICQFRIVKKQPEIEFEVVEHMEDKDRGGHGSTGTN